MLTFRSILCPVDFSDQSQLALRWAVALAVRRQSRLTVLAAIDPFLAEPPKCAMPRPREAETEPALREFINAAPQEMATWTPQPAFDVRTGDATEMILEAATRLGPPAFAASSSAFLPTWL
jgi:nucleotide-binding universal stress UspA family protein